METGTTPVAATITVVQTVPSQITMHTIEDHELDKLTNISRPITLAVAGIAAGAFFSFLPACINSFGSLNSDRFGRDDLFYSVITALSLIIAGYFGFTATRGELDARAEVKRIRQRQQRPF